jgi:ribulose-phosphate 3-epimerase
MVRIFPSLIGAPLLELKTVINILDPEVDGYHIDIMDNHFVPNLTWGAAFIDAFAHATQKVLWIHLMVTDPMRVLAQCNNIPSRSIISFHYHNEQQARQLIDFIHNIDCLASITLTPDTDPASLYPLLFDVDHVLVMTVKPGFSGQKFLSNMVPTIQTLYKYTRAHNLMTMLAADGGINCSNIALLASCGITDVAVAHAIFSAPDYQQAVRALRESVVHAG